MYGSFFFLRSFRFTPTFRLLSAIYWGPIIHGNVNFKTKLLNCHFSGGLMTSSKRFSIKNSSSSNKPQQIFSFLSSFVLVLLLIAVFSLNQMFDHAEGVPSSSSDRFSHRSARSADRHLHRQSAGGGHHPTSRPGASKKTSTSSSGTAGGGIVTSGTPRAGGGGSSSTAGGSGGNRNSAHQPSRSSEETTTGGSASETETDAERYAN